MADDKDVYKQRTEIFALAMHLARQLKYEVGARRDKEEPDWPVLCIQLPTGQLAIHAKAEDVPVMELPAFKHAYDGHSDEDKSRRIKEYLDL